MIKVCHLTSAHPQEDIRIFHKECTSLAAAGYRVYLVSCGEQTYEKNDVRLIGVGKPASRRINRMSRTARKVYEEAVKIDAEIYHFHDPELFPYALKLKKKGKMVIFDSHEDIPAQIMDKTWIPAFLRRIVSFAYKRYETLAVSKMDAVVAATPYIARQFDGRARKVSVINNYPKLRDVGCGSVPISNRKAVVCYAGSVSDARGEGIMIEAMRKVNGKLFIAGMHEKGELGNVHYLGVLDRKAVNDLYGESVLGLCLLKPIANYINSQPTKMYEYMAAGIPFVCSDFPLWHQLVEESGSGICVDPTNIACVADAINSILDNRERAEQMGRNGRLYMKEHFTWENEEKELISLYQSLSYRG